MCIQLHISLISLHFSFTTLSLHKPIHVSPPSPHPLRTLLMLILLDEIHFVINSGRRNSSGFSRTWERKPKPQAIELAVYMKRFSSESGSKNQSERTKRERLHGKGIMKLRGSKGFTESNTMQIPGLPPKNEAEARCISDVFSDVDLLEDKEVTACTKDVGEDQERQAVDECCGRERLQRHRLQIAGNVWIPDTWGQEDRLKEWTDLKALNQAWVPNGLMSARTALVEDCRTGGQPKRVPIDLKAV